MATRLNRTISRDVLIFPLHTCFNLAFAHSIMQNYDDKMKLYLVKKKAGMRVKKPKKPFIPFKFV